MGNEILRDNIPLTKSLLKEFKSLIKSKEYFMLSELIDNSLSSYIRHTNHNFENKSDDYDERGFIKKIDDFIVEINYKKGKSVEDNTITIIDNAYGIQPENIREVLTPGENTNSKDSRLNVYGMGLKQAAWWSGQCLEILTKREELEYSSFIEIDLNDGKPSDEVIFEVLSDEREIRFIYDNNEFYKHGTRIEISKLNLNHYKKLSEQIISLAQDWNNIDLFGTSHEITIPAISLKYKKWIEKGMKIIFSYTDENDSNNDVWFTLNTNSFNIPIEQPIKTLKKYVADIYRQNKERRDKYNSEDDLFVAALGKILDEIKKDDFAVKNGAYQLAEDILLNYNERENFEIREKLRLDIPGLEKEIFVEFKYISLLEERSKFFSRYRGLYIYDNDRAIYTGPNKKGEANEQSFGTYDIYPEGSVTRDNDLNLRSLFGEMDIDSLIAEKIISLDSNKRGIISYEGTTKSFSDAISNAAKEFVNKYGPLITKINKWYSSTKGETQKPIGPKGSNRIIEDITERTQTTTDYIWDESSKTITETKTPEEAKNVKKSPGKQLLAKVTLKLNSKQEEIFLSITEEAGEKYSYPYRYNLERDIKKHTEVYDIKLNVQSALFMPSLNEIDSDNRKMAKESIKKTFYKMSLIDILSDIIINRHLEYVDNNIDDDFFSLVYKNFKGNLFDIKNFLVDQVFKEND